jgi:transcription elongation factor Elf1
VTTPSSVKTFVVFPKKSSATDTVHSKSTVNQHDHKAGSCTHTENVSVEGKKDDSAEIDFDSNLASDAFSAQDEVKVKHVDCSVAHSTVLENVPPTGQLQSPNMKENELETKNTQAEYTQTQVKKSKPVVKILPAQKRTGHWDKNPAASFIYGRGRGRPGIDYSKCNICKCTLEHTGGYEKLRYQWLKHQAQNHPETAPFTCKLCGKPSLNSLSLKQHMLLVHKQGTQALAICQYCGKSVRRCFLKTHIKIHLGKKDHICQVCSKAFVNRGQLTSHMKTHTQIKDHICDICGMAFAWAGNMRTHRRRHEKAGLTPLHLSDRAKLKTTNDK